MLCGLLPLAMPITVLAAASFTGRETVELLVAPVLVGVALFEIRTRGAPATRLRWPALALASLIAGSTAVILAGQTPPPEFGARLVPAVWRYATGTYFVEAQHFAPLHDTMVWLGGLALAVVVERALREAPAARDAMTRMAIFGAAAAAAFAVYRLAEISLRREDPIGAAVGFLISLRFNPHVADLNAGGSLYALFEVPATWLAIRARRREMWIAAPFLLLAIWVTGSRSALAASVVAGGLAWAWDRRVSRRILAGAVVGILAAAWLVTLNTGRNEASPGLALGIRARLVPVALQLSTYRPVFGLGLGRFRPASAGLMDEELRTMFPGSAGGENAHNNYLQILVELGLAGLATWLWMLGTVARAFVISRRSAPLDPGAVGVAAGLAAFLITCLGGHPLLIPQVLLPYSLVLGLAAGLVPESPSPGTRRRQAFVAAGVVSVLLLSLTWRLP
jgi:O-antigen ligase